VASIERAANLFRALGDSSRLRLLSRLIDGHRCVGELADAEKEAMSTISQRLRVLRTENIVVRHRRGKHIHYSLVDRHVAELVINALAHADETPEFESKQNK
jgi:ArsR family transcriptional regulator